MTGFTVLCILAIMKTLTSFKLLKIQLSNNAIHATWRDVLNCAQEKFDTG